MLRKGVGWKVGIFRASNVNAIIWLAFLIPLYHLNDRTSPRISPPTTFTQPTLELIIRFFAGSSSRAGTPPNFHLRLSGPAVLTVFTFAPSLRRNFSPLFPAHVKFLGSAYSLHTRHSRRAEIPRHSVGMMARCPCCGRCKERGQYRAGVDEVRAQTME